MTSNLRWQPKNLLLVSIAAGLIATAGCGGSPSMVPVSGTITLNGKPLKGAQVTFTPVPEPGSPEIGLSSHGETDDSGKFTLSTIDGQTGAVAGKHKVILSTLEATADETGKVKITRPELVPKKYIDTPPIFEVPAAGTDEAKIEL
jgi:hypothetical protein